MNGYMNGGTESSTPPQSPRAPSTPSSAGSSPQHEPLAAFEESVPSSHQNSSPTDWPDQFPLINGTAEVSCEEQSADTDQESDEVFSPQNTRSSSVSLNEESSLRSRTRSHGQEIVAGPSQELSSTQATALLQQHNGMLASSTQTLTTQLNGEMNHAESKLSLEKITPNGANGEEPTVRELNKGESGSNSSDGSIVEKNNENPLPDIEDQNSLDDVPTTSENRLNSSLSNNTVKSRSKTDTDSQSTSEHEGSDANNPESDDSDLNEDPDNEDNPDENDSEREAGENGSIQEINSDSDDSDNVRSSHGKLHEISDTDSEEETSDEEGSDVSDAENDEPVSIPDSDDSTQNDSDKDTNSRQESTEIMLVDDASDQGSQGPVKSNICGSPTVLSDTDEYDEKGMSITDVENQLRRSARKVSRTSYKSLANDESDIEEVSINDSTSRDTAKNPIIVSDTKKLVDLAVTHSINSTGQNKEPTVVIIDTDTNKNIHDSRRKLNLPMQSIYQSIAARGTTVTPVSKPVHQTSTSVQTAQANILPSLTDDMFVVEAPSFIVPYVYEKPSTKPFREFVDTLANEIKVNNEDKTNEDGSEVEELLRNSLKPQEEKKSKKSKRGHDDDESWDGSTTSDSEDISDEERPKMVVIKEKGDASLESVKSTTDLTGDVNIVKMKSDNYFDNPLGKFFMNIGLNQVQEHVQTDLLKQQKRKLYKESRTGSANVKATESAINSLMKNIDFSRSSNKIFKFSMKKCDYCTFKTESALSLAHHMETPHMKNNVYCCNFCNFEIKSPHDILYHMEAEHNIRGRLERAPAYHQCPNCPFEDNGKGKLARHTIACAKKFKPDHNLAPPVEWEPPAKIPKMTRARHSMMNTYQTALNKGQASLPRAGPSGSPASGLSASANAALFRGRGRPSVTPTLPTQHRPLVSAPLIRGGLVYRNTQLLIPTNYQLLQGGQTTIRPNVGVVPKSGVQHQPSISITPLPRNPAVAPPPLVPLPAQSALPGSVGAGAPSKATFVICEICDGYIKDLEQLRNHMQWIHKVKIHPKMIYNRPPLNCQKCQFRFFTDQGLERHLLGSHGLVTSSMQDAANKGKDAGRCPACGRVYQWKLLHHVARDHNMTLKPAHLSYKCTVCTATFGMYKHFENHVYSAHSVVAKRVTEKNKSSSPSTTPSTSGVAISSRPSSITESLLKPLKINNEITIIPQSPKSIETSEKKD